MIELGALIVGTVTTSLLALTVFAKDSHSVTNKFFIGLTIGLVGWSVTNYLSLHTLSGEQTLFWIRWIMFFVVLQNTSFFLLVKVFPAKQLNIFRQKKYILAIIYSIITAAVAVSPFLFTDFREGAPVPGLGMILFLPHALVFAVGGLIALIARYRKARGLEKAQLQYFLAGTLLMFTLVPIGNFIIPVVFKQNQFVIFSPLYSIIFSGLIAFAIITKRLFDIRAVVARSVAYVLLVFTLGSIYGLTVFGFVDQFFPGTRTSALQMSIYTLLAVFLAFTFQPLRRFFERLTDKIFYRDKYDSQEVLSKLGNIFVSKINSFELLDDSLEVIVNALRVELGHFIIIDDDKVYKTANYGVHLGESIDPDELKNLRENLTIYDELSEDSQQHEMLRQSKVYSVLKLYTQDGLIGYLLLGHKQNGSIYTQQDINLLEILSQELAVAIQNAKSYEKISKFSETLKQEVDEATAQLRETNRKLRKLDQAKDEFISMASHQLRTPLTTVKGYLSMLLEGDAGKIPKKQREFADLAFISSERMVHLIADMLNVSRISTGRLVIDKAPFDLEKVVKSEVEQLNHQAEARGVELNFHPPKEQLPKLNLDEGKIRQVVMNFIDNAIYYSPNGKVDVRLKIVEDWVRFTVKDNGIGVSEEEQKQLFSKFFRASNAQHVRPDGTGLGLYMAKMVVEAQNGRIIFSSTEGKGSTFGFEFPLETETAVAEAKESKPQAKELVNQR